MYGTSASSSLHSVEDCALERDPRTFAGSYHGLSLPLRQLCQSLLSESRRGSPLCLPDPLPIGSSGAEFIPKGIRSHRYRPNGVLKYVNILDFSCSAFCQNPFFVSNTVNNLAFFSRVLTFSMVGIGYYSHLIAVLRSFGSRHILICPLGF